MLSAGISQRSYSLLLQRVVTDFGADHAFNKVHAKMKEHYGIAVPLSAPRIITLRHATQIADEQEKNMLQQKWKGKGKKNVISETDVSMVPIVTTDPNQKDKRKHKTLQYREARLSLAHEQGSASPIFAATLKDVKTTGKHILACVQRVGMDHKTHVHCVGDGASWIEHQIEECFGKQASYLIDFYHVCEYLAAAAPCCNKDNPKQWTETQKVLLKDNCPKEVLKQLNAHIEPENVLDADAPVRACWRYLSNRLNQLDYKSAIEKDLPIGSGEIESAHRYIIQKRLKIQGSWWLEASAEAMLFLRTNRANNDWDDYWTKIAA